MRSPFWIEVSKHAFILGVLAFAFFPGYVTLVISVKNNKQFNNAPFLPLSPSGISETFRRVPASQDAYDPRSITAARRAVEEGTGPDSADWPQVRYSSTNTWHWENWLVAWDTVGTYIFNTVAVAVTSVALALACSISAAFFFASFSPILRDQAIISFFITFLYPIPVFQDKGLASVTGTPTNATAAIAAPTT